LTAFTESLTRLYLQWLGIEESKDSIERKVKEESSQAELEIARLEV
jgi:hypothetical protein